MKKIIALVLSIIILLSVSSFVFAADSTMNLVYNLTYLEKNDVNVPANTIITVSFLVGNKAGENFSLEAIQNEIYFDHEFFEFVRAYESNMLPSEVNVYSSGKHYVFVNTTDRKDYSANQLVAKFDLRVKEKTIGASSVISTTEPIAFDADGNIVKTGNIEKKNLKITVSEIADTFTITYVVDTTETKIDYIQGATIPLSAAPEKEGYRFKGWKKADGTIYPAGSDFLVNEDVRLEAVWEQKARYKITFDTDGGSPVDPITGYDGDVVAINETSKKDGYIFQGWYLDDEFRKEAKKVTLSDNVTVYAKWEKESSGGGGGGGGGISAAQYTIFFKTVDGVELGSIKKVGGVPIVLSAYTYAKEGHKFEGWYLDRELKNRVKSVTLDKDITLYANWVKASDGAANNRPEILTDAHYAYIVGRENNMVAPQANITRAEVATIFFRLLKENIRNDYYSKENSFADVNSGDWFNTAVSTLAKIGVLSGRTETEFAPNASITRAEFATIAARLASVVGTENIDFSDINGHWAYEYIKKAASLGWVIGENGLFRPDDNITRAEAMTLVNRVLVRQPETVGDILSEEMVKFADNADVNAWYYLAVQEATNSHDYEMKADGKHEKWTQIIETPDWTKLEK